MRRVSALSVVALAASFTGLACNACDCNPEPVVSTECKIEVTPSGSNNEIQFSDTPVGGSSERSWRVKNAGKGVVLGELHATFESVNGDNYATDIPGDLNLGPGDEQTLVVTFHPTAATELASSFVVSHPDVGSAKCNTQTVFVRGTGFEEQEVDAGFPDAGFPDAGNPDGGPDVDAGTVANPDGGVVLPDNGEWFAYGAFEDARARFAAVLLKDGTGNVLAVGGFGEDGVALDSIERFDPKTGISKIVAHMAAPRAEPAAALLPDGKVMIMGGRSAPVDGFAMRTVEIFDPSNDSVSCADTGGCGLNAQGSAVLPVGRIGAIATSTSTGVMLMFGRTLDVANNNAEIFVAGGDLITLSPGLTRAAIGNQGLLTEREGVATVVDDLGNMLLIGGTDRTAAQNGAVLTSVQRVDAVTHSIGNVGDLQFPRSFASAALLSTGDVVVAGGFSGNGSGVVDIEKIEDAFGASPVISQPDIQITARTGGSLLALSGDILLWAGGMTRNTSGLSTVQSELPQSGADVLVPFGTNSFLRLSPDNDLAQGRFEHQALAISSDGAFTGERDTALFLGGVDTSPRRTPHPHAERYILDENRFLTYGLMGSGTAIEASATSTSGAALISAGGIDPHTGRTSSAVRGFDADGNSTAAGTYFEDGALQEPRRDHTITRLAFNPANILLVAGGRDENGAVLSSLSFFDTVSGVDRPLPVSLRTARAEHTATLLADDNPLGVGSVLFCGGVGVGGEALDTCEVFVPPSDITDPNTFDEARVVPVQGRMTIGRVAHTATILDSGEVLLVGGGDVTVDLVKADLFAFTTTADHSPFIRQTGQPNTARRGHASVFIGSGRVLIVGGDVDNGGQAVATRSAELYVRASEAFLPLPDMEDERSFPAAFLLGDGNVLIAGGSRNNAGVDPAVPTRSNKSAELYVTGPDGTGTFEELPNTPLSYGRSDVRFIDVFGRAIVTGGDHRDGIFTTGDERHTPITFVDFLQDPLIAVGH